MKVSFEGIGEMLVTCYAESGTARGMVVKMTDNGEVGPCSAGDRFCGVAVSVAEDSFAAVQMGGLGTVGYSGGAPVVGWVKLSADATGGVAVDETSGVAHLVVSVDSAAGTVAGTLDYDDLVDFWSQFDPYEMNTLLVGGSTMTKMLKLPEFQNPLTGLNFQGTGKLDTPLGAKLLRTSAMPAGTIIGLDKKYSLEMVKGSDVMIEYDKLIDRQLERAAITSISGFAKIFADASKALKI
jgi:hypothetical protein